MCTCSQAELSGLPNTLLPHCSSFCGKLSLKFLFSDFTQEGDDQENSWRLFTSEDMIQGYKGLKRRKTSRTVKQDDVLKTTKRPPRKKDSLYKEEMSQSSRNHGTMSIVDRQERINTTPLCAMDGHNKPCRSGERVNFEEMDVGSSTPKSTLSSLHETSEILEGQPAKIFLQAHDRPLRTPLSDITNNLSRNRSNTSANRGKGKFKASNFQPQSLEPFSRNLFDEEISRTPTTDKVIYDEDLEETRLPSSYLSDESLSDVETSYEDQYIEEDFDGHSGGVFDTEDTHPNLTKNKKRSTRGSKYLIPEEYATLGAPSEVCSYCKSVMWHEEREPKLTNLTATRVFINHDHEAVGDLRDALRLANWMHD